MIGWGGELRFSLICRPDQGVFVIGPAVGSAFGGDKPIGSWLSLAEKADNVSRRWPSSLCSAPSPDSWRQSWRNPLLREDRAVQLIGNRDGHGPSSAISHSRPLGVCPTLGDDHSEYLPSMGKWYSSRCNQVDQTSRIFAMCCPPGHVCCAPGRTEQCPFALAGGDAGETEGSAAEPYHGTTVRASAHKDVS
jgi:hypothetical protein